MTLMSKITNPETEQSVTCGFYNSLNDRKYDSYQMSTIFDGIIRDGIFSSIGGALVVNASNPASNTVVVSTGKCWFNHTWTLNDAPLPIDCEPAHDVLNRIDAIVVKIDGTQAVRDNFIHFKKGTESSTPVKPTLEHSDNINEYALCYIYREAQSTEIKQVDITNAVGTEETPFITGILQTVSLDELLGQWQDELDQFVDSKKAEMDAFMQSEANDVDKFISDMEQLMIEAMNELNTWTYKQQATILDWFDHMKGQLSADSAANLQIQIDEDEVERILMVGLASGTKTISEDGTVITTVNDQMSLIKTFTNNFSTCTTVLYSSAGGELGRLAKEFSSDGTVITSELTIF